MQACKILVVEDESLVAMDMVDMLARLGYDLVPNAMGFQEAIQTIESNRPDLVLVDINLSSSKSGIELAQLLTEQYKIPFLFITSHSDKQTVTAAANTLPSGYLVKPFDAEDLYTSIEIALVNYASRDGLKSNAHNGLKVEGSLFIKTDKNFVKVKIEDILWLESEHNYIFVVTENGKFIVRSNFKDFMQNLPASIFLQVHKSYVVNISKVASFSNSELVIKNTTIPLSRNHKEDFFEKIKRIH
ncbi:MAG: hypothetical protein RLZZ28_2763 [Bacteroidota bacterium]